MADFKTEIKSSLETELDTNTFIMDIVNRLKDSIRQSIISPGVASVVIMDIFPSVLVPATETEPEHMVSTGEPLTNQQITQVQMACIKHIGVPVDVSPLQMVVYMINFLRVI
jgi:hypothetical protein